MRRDMTALALALVTLGAWLLPLIGWGIGVWLTWGSRRWTTFDKIVATLLWPYIIIAPGIAFIANVSTSSCTGLGCDPDGDTSVAPLIIIVGLYFAGIAWLSVELFRRRQVAV